jgi:hypothetical protein
MNVTLPELAHEFETFGVKWIFRNMLGRHKKHLSDQMAGELSGPGSHLGVDLGV